MNQITRYEEASNKAASESASITKKIADNRKKRNDAYLRLQKEQQSERKKQDKKIKDMHLLLAKLTNVYLMLYK